MEIRIPEFRPHNTPISQEQNIGRRKPVQEIRTVTEPDILEKDQAMLRHRLDPEAGSTRESHEMVIDQMNIRLSDLLTRLSSPEIKDQEGPGSENLFSISRMIINPGSWNETSGINLVSENLVESPRYQIIINSPSELVLIDKWGNTSVRIWGDPKANTVYKPQAEAITLMLQDYTQVTLRTHDAILITEVDIQHGKQHIIGQVVNRRNELRVNLKYKNILQFRAEREEPAHTHTIFFSGNGFEWINKLGTSILGKAVQTSNRYTRTGDIQNDAGSSQIDDSNLIELSA